jgi:hypothetical protein
VVVVAFIFLCCTLLWNCNIKHDDDDDGGGGGGDDDDDDDDDDQRFRVSEAYGNCNCAFGGS